MRFIAGQVVLAATLSPCGAPIAAMSFPAPLFENFILPKGRESRIDGAQGPAALPLCGWRETFVRLPLKDDPPIVAGDDTIPTGIASNRGA